MSKGSIFRDSQTDWKALNKMSDEDIDLSDIPEVTEEQIAHATLRVGGKPVARGKVRISIYLDAQIIEFFKTEAGSRYQDLINETLKESIRSKGFETVLRQIIREEMAMAA